MEQYGFYIIKDSFFERFNDPFLKGNHEENRPHYYAFKDSKTNLFWVIPISSKIDKFQRIIEKRKLENKPCDFIEVLTLANKKQSAFVIGDIFPVSEKYILRPYTINGIPFKIVNKKQNTILLRKSKRVISLIRKGVKFSPTQANVLKIENELLND